jgi:hypothetical protein
LSRVLAMGYGGSRLEAGEAIGRTSSRITVDTRARTIQKFEGE